MKIATFNINNVNRRLPNLLAWLRGGEARRRLPAGAEGDRRRVPGRGARARRLRRGVARAADLERRRHPGARRRADPDPATAARRPGDTQSRYIEAAVDGVLVASLYLPNGNPQPGPKFDYKLAWFERLIAHAAELLASGLPGGAGRRLQRRADRRRHLSVEVLGQERAGAAASRARRSRACSTQGWTDAIRARHPTGPVYTFWDYKRDRWARDAGLRLDHLLLSARDRRRLVDAGVDRERARRGRASDHAPAWVILGPLDRANAWRTRDAHERFAIAFKTGTSPRRSQAKY